MSDFVDYDSLIQIIRRNQQYLGGDLDRNGDYTVDMATNIIKTLRDNNPSIMGGFGIGFPFHSRTQSGELIPNPEFQTYSDKFIDNVESIRSLGYTAWVCSDCQSEQMKHRNICKECDKSIIKPRDVMKTIPDIDLFIISNDTSDKTLDNIQQTSLKYSFHQSDYNVRETLQRVERAFDYISGDDEYAFFPADLHVISFDNFKNALNEISFGNIDPNTEIYSMYYDWTINKDISFWLDFVFSGSFCSDICDPEIIDHVNYARKGLVSNLSTQNIIDAIKSKSRQASVLLEYEPTYNILSERINSWGSLQ